MPVIGVRGRRIRDDRRCAFRTSATSNVPHIFAVGDIVGELPRPLGERVDCAVTTGMGCLASQAGAAHPWHAALTLRSRCAR